VRRLLLSVLILLAVPATALAVRANPADELVDVPIEASVYDPATHCSPKPRPGTIALQAWLQENFRGVFWARGRRGRLRKNLNVTIAHRDHVHIGMTKAGAAGRTFVLAPYWLRCDGRR
jgi:hypothetical protein